MGILKQGRGKEGERNGVYLAGRALAREAKVKKKLTNQMA